MYTFAAVVIALSLFAWFAGPTHQTHVRKRRWWVVVLLSLLSIGCTSMQRVNTSAEDLQAQIRAGKFLEPGHDVTLNTRQGTEVLFKFKRIENDAIVGQAHHGDLVSQPIADVVGVKTRRFSVGRTAAAVGGGYALGVALVFAAFAIAF